MLTYPLQKHSGSSLYEQLYRAIKADILSGALGPGDKLPSKRMLANHLEVSVITVKTAYEQLIAEGYLYGVEKKGYFVSPVERLHGAVAAPAAVAPQREKQWFLDFAASSTAEEQFPFSTWARLMRRTILEQDTGLLRPTPSTGVAELRRAIAATLYQFRGLAVDPEQIIVGAGTEFLYSLP